MNNLSIVNKLFGFIGFIWLLFMLMFPSDFQEVKYITLIILLFLSIFEILNRKKNINKNLFTWIVLWITYFLLSLLIGILKGYSFGFSLISMYFLTPIVAFFLACIIDNEKRFISLNRMLVVITLMICLLDLFYILNSLQIISLTFDFGTDIFGSVVVSDEKLEFRITNQSSLIFLLPYIFTLNISQGYTNRKEKFLIWITVFLGIIVALLSGRRAFQGVVILAVIFSFLLISFKRRQFIVIKKGNPIKRIFQILLIIVVTISAYNWLNKQLGLENFLGSVYTTFLSAFDFSSGGGAVRAQQINMFIEGWGHSPLIGHGLNSHLQSYLASTTTPWSYEMVYMALLYQTGVIGILIFIGSLYFLLKKLYRRMIIEKLLVSSYFQGIIVGFLCFVFAGSTNPMVYYVWAWGIAITGYTLITKDDETTNSSRVRVKQER